MHHKFRTILHKFTTILEALGLQVCAHRLVVSGSQSDLKGSQAPSDWKMAPNEISIRDEKQSDFLTVAEAALRDVPSALPDIVCVGDSIDTDMQEGFLRHDHNTFEL